jgi:hypothetical protein
MGVGAGRDVGVWVGIREDWGMQLLNKNELDRKKPRKREKIRTDLVAEKL